MQQISDSAVPICWSSRQNMEGMQKVEMRQDSKLWRGETTPILEHQFI